MHSMRRSCQSALRGSNTICAYGHGTTRAFSRSCARSRGALPIFLEPSSPELSSLLSTLNRKVLAPEHFTKEQKELVYRQKNKAKLEAEPVEITLGDVTIPLEHIDRNHAPNTGEVYTSILKQSQSEEDCENIIRMLEGFHDANKTVRHDWQIQAINTLLHQGKHHLVLKALQRVKSTGLSLKNYEILQRVLRAMVILASNTDSEKEQITKALKMTQQVIALLETQEHTGEAARGEMISEQDHRGKAFVIAVPTKLTAILAEKHDGPVNELEKLVRRLLSATKQDDYNKLLESITSQSSQTEEDFRNGVRQMSACTRLAAQLYDVQQVVHAISLSKKVLGTNMPLAEDVQQFESKTLPVLEDGIAAADRLRHRGGEKWTSYRVEELKRPFLV